VLMDEVTSSLDPVARRGVEVLARDLVDGGLTVVWVTHDLRQADRIADQTVVLVDGRVADEARSRRFLADLDGTLGPDEHLDPGEGP
jgi:ABC-type phosphate transport system ATPase subunit